VCHVIPVLATSASVIEEGEFYTLFFQGEVIYHFVFSVFFFGFHFCLAVLPSFEALLTLLFMLKRVVFFSCYYCVFCSSLFVCSLANVA
jgi:hypothetical protein